jgi:probable F420-dependent oxidoreductase
MDTKLEGRSPQSIARNAVQSEDQGYDGLWTAELNQDPFLPLVLAAEHTRRVTLGSSIAVAFARSPMQLAYSAYDLNWYAQGRFVLGLGSQVKAHIERRFAMPWSHPAARMREFVMAMRAIWTSWAEGVPLDFQGEFYRHNLMTPFFSPERNPYGGPPVFLAAVGAVMTEVAGEVCDGIFLHGFTTARYLREVTIPALERGMQRSGRERQDFEIAHMPFVVTGRDEAEQATARRAVCSQIAFYGSTPAYRGVLAAHGWEALGDELHLLSRSDRDDKWVRMGEMVPEDVLRAFAVVAEPADLASALLERWSGLVDRIQFYAPYAHDGTLFADTIAEVHRLSAAASA